jgi:branched-chain amino acid transport system ATP-binding protein
MCAMTILETRELTKYFGGVHALDGVEISIERNEIHGLIGPNGSGKTTFRNLVTGLLPVTEGAIWFEGEEITGLSAHERTKLGIASTFQIPRVVPDLTCLENVALGSHCRTKLDFRGTFLRLPFTASAQERHISERASELLGFVGLAAMAERRARDLSWVEGHLLQLARALASDPRLLILDEPTAGMGGSESVVVQSIIKKVRDSGVTCIVIAHDMGMIMGICDKISVLCFGHKVAYGTPPEIQNDPKVLEVYLGEE